MMKSHIVIALLVVLVAPPSRADAQSPPLAQAAAQEGGAVEFGKNVMTAFSKPFHPVVKSVAPGGGFGVGIGYKRDRQTGGPWFFRSEAVITPRKYWSTEVDLQYQHEWLHGELYGRAREMTRLDFYGIGGDTNPDERTTFRFTDRSAGGLASIRLPTFDILAFGGRLEQLWPSIGSGRNTDYPSIEHRFTEIDVPGLAAQPGFTAYSGFVNLNYPGGNALGRHGADVQLSYSAYRDQENGRYDFDRINIESQQRLPGFGTTHLLTLHQYFSTTNADDVVPFYLQYTLGGVGSVRPFNEETLGSDATKATLRGFQDLRFRGPHLLLLQAEYRFKVKGPLDATVFVDAGEVTTRRSALTLTDMNANVGFSMSFMTIDATALRVDLGGGGGEGVRVFFSVGPIFQR